MPSTKSSIISPLGPFWARAAWLVPTLLLATSCFPNPDDLRGGGGGTSGAGGSGGGGSCTNPMFPKACPALNGAPAGCWGADTVCSTVTTCNSDPVACKSASLKVYCAGDQCCTPPAAGGTCNLPDCGCPTGQVCYPSTPTAGLACYPTSNAAEGADCSSNFSACASGLGCFGEMCKEYCQTDADCTAVDGVRACIQTFWKTTGANISGVLVCDRICDPVSPASPRSPLLACPAGFGCDTTDKTGVTDCWKRTGSATTRTSCTDNAGCAPGYFCSAPTGGTAKVCWKYCFSNGDCPSSSTLGVCSLFSPAVSAGTRPLGACMQ